MPTSACWAMPWRVTPPMFAREDYVEEAWRIVDPVLKAGTSGLSNTRRAPGGPVRSTEVFRSRRRLA